MEMDKKFRSRLIRYSLYGVSFLFPRNKNKWVFGTYIVDTFNDNPKYLFLYINEHRKNIKAIWITKDDRVYARLKNLGLLVYKNNSLRGKYHCLTAKVYFYNAYAEDINFFTSGGATLVNLWHGVGLKKIEFNIKKGILAERYNKRDFEYRFYNPWVYKRPSYLVSSTNFQSIPFSTAFRIPLKKCLNVGYPRNDLFFLPEAQRKEFAEKYELPETLNFIEKLSQFDKVHIYMPTWRDNVTFLIDLHIDFTLINEKLKSKNAALILKLHINTAPPGNVHLLSNILFLPGNTDVYSILPYTDNLITDYSSVLYDYVLLQGKEVVLFVFDLEEYLADREFNYPFLPNVAGVVIKSVDELYRVFDNTLNGESVNDINAIRERFWGTYNGDASKAITDIIFKKIH